MGTGLRLGEIVGLDVGDVYLPDGTPRVRVRLRPEIAKGGRAGDVFLPDALLPRLRRFRRYKVVRGESLAPEAPLAEHGPVSHSHRIITDLLPDRPRCEVEMMRRGGKLPRRTSGYDSVLTDVVHLIESARRSAARSVNTVLTTTYWEIGRRIVEQEQRGEARAGYAEELMMRLARDLAARFGRGFGWRNLFQMRAFYLAYRQRRGASSTESSPETEGRKLQTASAISGSPHPTTSVSGFVLPWSHYVRLVALRSEEARRFYEAEALRGGWTIRQLDRQIDSQFYERTLLSKNKAAMLRRGERPAPDDAVTPEEEVKDPYVLEFLGLRDEYSETEAEAALLEKLESFLMELGGDFAFVGRQRRLRVGDAWYRVDLVFFHRTLRCLVIVDLKLGTFTHADSGQMHVYLNYARENWMRPGENPPVGLILCARKNEVLAHYALDGLPNKVLAAEYRTTLPDEHVLAERVARARTGLPRSGGITNPRPLPDPDLR